MEWADVLADPCLRNLPYKIELDTYGRILMSPASNRHGRVQAWLAHWLALVFNHGAIIAECSPVTRGGVRVPDLVWASAAFVAHYGDTTPFPRAPDLCVEIVSPSNTPAALAEKVALYLEAGAREVWLVREDGTLAVYGPEGERQASQLADRPIPMGP